MIDYSNAYENKIVLLNETTTYADILSKYELDYDTINNIKNLIKKDVNVIYDKKYNFEKYFEEYYSIVNVDSSINNEFLSILDKNIDILFDYIIKKAHSFSSSDIHIICEDNCFVIKFRINSILRTFSRIKEDKGQALLRIIKLKSNIELSKTLSPLEGRFDYENLTYRVSIIPTVFGEKITLRVLGNIKNIYTFADIGLSDEDQALLLRKIHKNSGFIIITGSTGSGKSTTLFTIMHRLNDGTKNIISIEDPVEYKINGITQIQVSQEKQIDFHNILKFVLRQDPQIINIGEIRDYDTAKMAIQSANTGHLVFSTMHTNDSISSINRLKDLGIVDFDIANSLNLIISQRLIRTLCPYCKKEYIPNTEILNYYKLDKNKTYFKKCGCNNCYHTGYDNQIAVFEILEVDDNIKHLIQMNNLEEKNIKIITIKDKIKNLVQNGITTIEELSKYM